MSDKVEKLYLVGIAEGDFSAKEVEAGFKFDTVYKISDPEPDRDKDTVEPRGGDFSNYHDVVNGKTQGPVLDQHDRWSAMVSSSFVWSDDSGVYAGVRFADVVEGHKQAEIIAGLIRNDFPVKASIGFIIKQSEPNEHGGLHIIKWELLEWSFVNVPAHPKTGKIKSYGEFSTIEVDIDEYKKLKTFFSNKSVLKKYRDWLKHFREYQELPILPDEIKSLDQVFESLDTFVKASKAENQPEQSENREELFEIDPESEIGKAYLKNLALARGNTK
jgi:hypothetical protein